MCPFSDPLLASLSLMPICSPAEAERTSALHGGLKKISNEGHVNLKLRGADVLS